MHYSCNEIYKLYQKLSRPVDQLIMISSKYVAHIIMYWTSSVSVYYMYFYIPLINHIAI